jgi:hypothetical protein
VEVARKARERWEARERKERMVGELADRLKELLPGRERLWLLVRAGGRERRLLLHRLLLSDCTYALLDEEGRPVSTHSCWIPPDLLKIYHPIRPNVWRQMAEGIIRDLAQLLGAEPEAVEPQP